MINNWPQQSPGKPLFPDMLWSKPENKIQAGRLLIIGGNGYEFQSAANGYGDALSAGVGDARVILPASLQKTVQKIFPEAHFAPSTPSGSFSRAALAEILDLSQWANGLLLPGNIGRNSETTIMLETLLNKYDGQVTLAGDALEALEDSLLKQGRPKTLAIADFRQLRQLGSKAGLTTAFTANMGLLPLVQNLRQLSQQLKMSFISYYQDSYVLASFDKASLTKAPDQANWAALAATFASVWWLQNPKKEQTFKALNCALYEIINE